MGIEVVRRLAERIAYVNGKWPDLAMKSMIDKADSLNEAVLTQMKLGLRPNGDKIGEYAEVSRRYAEWKKESPNYAYDVPERGLMDVNLLNTGDFYRGMQLEQDDEGIALTSSDEKWPKIMEKYGAGAIGVPADWVGEVLKPQILENARAMIFSEIL